ncbi:CoA transferase [Rhizobium sp. FY34]|uniref:CoA transferase n=1 Tax=Rhizobium sp. FY34 TaxID=2562309 RepID=UPI0010C0E1CF|nr:CoA transferase [Rhizobium sp. FY34]
MNIKQDIARATHAHAFLAEIWQGLGGAASLAQEVQFTGDRALPSPFAATDLAAASFAAAGLAVAELMGTAGQKTPSVTVDRTLASGWFHLPPGPSRLIGTKQTTHGTGPWMTEFATGDGRWLRVQGSMPTLRRRAAEALGVAETPEAFAAEICKYDADDIEQRLIDAGAAVAASRTLNDWRAHPQGQALQAEPIAQIDINAGTAGFRSAWKPTPGRPLAGLRVLDMTRVVSGPVATRFLASCGAEVLRLDAPGSDESQGMFGAGNDLGLGKRWAFLDMRSPEGMQRFLDLVSRADVLFHGYRPGSLEKLGITSERLDEAQPDLVQVRLNAYGWTGPWKERRGFDSLVQYSTGICNATSEWAQADLENRLPLVALGLEVDASRPRHLPVEVLDFGTAYQLAAAAIRGLTRRLTTGRGSTARLSLARTARLLYEQGFVSPQPVIKLPLDGPWEAKVYASPRGATEQLVSPLAVEGNPFYWDRPYEKAGASVAIWSCD